MEQELPRVGVSGVKESPAQMVRRKLTDLRTGLPKNSSWTISHKSGLYVAILGACVGNIELCNEDPVRLLASIYAAEQILMLGTSAEMDVEP